MNIDDVKKLVQEKEINNEKDKERVKLISDLLETDNCFFNIDKKLAIDILWYLGVEKDKLLDNYYELLSPKNFKVNKVVQLVDNDTTNNIDIKNQKN